MIEAIAVRETPHTGDPPASEWSCSPESASLRRLPPPLSRLAHWLIAQGISPDKAHRVGRCFLYFAAEEALPALGPPIRIGLTADALRGRLRLVASLVWPAPLDPALKGDGVLARRLKSRFNELTVSDSRHPELRSSLHIVSFAGSAQSPDDYFRGISRQEKEVYLGILCKKVRLPRTVTVSRPE